MIGDKLNPHMSTRCSRQKHAQVFCVATSRIILSEQRAVDAVESGGVGIAQLFKHFRRHGKIMKRMEQWDIHFTWFLYVFILFIQVHMYIYNVCV